MCAFVDANANGIIDPGEAGASNPSYQQNLPAAMRGFDDPQADPDLTLELKQTTELRYTRADQYNLPPVYVADDVATGNPPWGSQVGDGDADGIADGAFIPNRRNQGAYAAIYDNDRGRPPQQLPGDAFGEPSCPLPPLTNPCDPYLVDCGGYAHYNSFKGFPASAPTGFTPYPIQQPASPPDWPVVPFKRDWMGTDAQNVPVMKKLLRFASSIVSYNSSAASADIAYTLEEDAKNVVVTAPGTPMAGVLHDAYNYFVKSVFPTPGGVPQDPAIDCRNYIIVYITDGHDECGSDACVGGPTGNGPSGDLGAVLLPESAAGRRAAANALDPSVRIKGIPVFVVSLTTDPAFVPPLTCIATNSGGQVFQASDRTQLSDALASILNFKRSANFFAAPSVPAFASGFGDSAQLGAVIPSHENPNGSLSIWSIWSGSLKSFKLDANGLIPVVTGTNPTATPSGPTATPSAATPTPTPAVPSGSTYPDETLPDDPSQATRRPVWNAARVLGYTDPVANLGEGAAAIPANPASKAPAISVWPGRKMIFGRSGANVPLTRADFLPNTGTCTGVAAGNCFEELISNMGLLPTSSVANQTLAAFTVQFLRGGETPYGSREEVLNKPTIKPAAIGVIGPGVGQEQKYSYFYQDDQPAPGNPQVRTDDNGTPPAGYSHKLGDIFHSEPLMLEPPRYFQYISGNLAPRTSTTTFGEPYIDFANRQGKRRKAIFVGSNDGFLHAFDAGVFDRDAAFPNNHDLGTGREIFAYAPTSVMNLKFPNLLNFPPVPQYFVDGSMGASDVFIDPAYGGAPNPSDRVWRTALVGSLRQGGTSYYALDVTQPDDIDTVVASPTFGEIIGSKDASPGCLNGGGTSCTAGATSNRKYPEIMWEMTDAGVACSDGCSIVPAMGETWSRPVIGRVQVYDPTSATADPSGFDARFVAIFGGGLDPSFRPGDNVAALTPNGRAFYLVDVETGKILYKTAEGKDAGGATVNFAPMPAAAAVADYNDDGFLDVAYIGDVNGQMWRIDLTANSSTTPKRGEILADGQLHGYQPFLLFDGCQVAAGVCTTKQPIFYEPGIVFLGGAATPPVLGIAIGTGDRSDLTASSPAPNSFFYVVDSGQTTTTFKKIDLRDLTPGQAGPCPTPYDPATCANASNGFVLDFATVNEKTTSTVYSTQGFLSLITFTPDSVSPCATNGSSFRYRFFFLTGQGGYGAGSTYPDFQQSLGSGFAAASQSTSPQGDTIDTVLFSGGSLQEDVTAGTLRAIEQNWKEQQ